MKQFISFVFASLIFVATVHAQFHPGPYGIDPYQIAAPFILPTLDGDWDFRANWNGLETYVFIQYARGHAYGDPLWNSSKLDLLMNSPNNVHYFFLSFDNNATNARNDVTAMKAGFDAALQNAVFTQQQRDHWMTHLHYVTTPAWSQSGWVGDVLRKVGYFSFAIDRFQRMRPMGLLSFVANPSPPPEMFFIANEPKYFNYEWETEQKIRQNPAIVEIPVYVNADKAGNRFSGAIQFPDADAMKQFDRMEFDVSFGCVDHSVNNCFEWDYLANLYICDDADTTICSKEIGRWVTAYRREGRWVTDATQFLPFVVSGGTKRFRFNTQDRWIVNMIVRLYRSGSGLYASEAIPLWTGGQFNLQYNPAKQPYKLDFTSDMKKVEIVALISGHGFGADMENCAEFCNHTHHFSVNGREWVKAHPEAGTQFGCLEQVPSGVTPNQYGTWYFGRGGWCPGQDVKPFVADITSALTPGENNIAYRALFKGKDYDPVPRSGGGTFWGRIDLSSYLVIWRSAPLSANSIPATMELSLFQNYPNPFRGTTRMTFTIGHTSLVDLSVHDMAGRRVATVLTEYLSSGKHDVMFDAGNLQAGIYVVRLAAQGASVTRRMIVVR